MLIRCVSAVAGFVKEAEDRKSNRSICIAFCTICKLSVRRCVNAGATADTMRGLVLYSFFQHLAHSSREKRFKNAAPCYQRKTSNWFYVKCFGDISRRFKIDRVTVAHFHILLLRRRPTWHWRHTSSPARWIEASRSFLFYCRPPLLHLHTGGTRWMGRIKGNTRSSQMQR